MLQDLSLREGLIVFPEKGISGRITVPIRVLADKWWKKWRDGEDMAMMRSDGRIGSFDLELENTKKGGGRGADGGVKLLRSSRKNLEGGGMAVITSSISSINPIKLNTAKYGRRYVIMS